MQPAPAPAGGAVPGQAPAQQFQPGAGIPTQPLPQQQAAPQQVPLRQPVAQPVQYVPPGQAAPTAAPSVAPEVGPVLPPGPSVLEDVVLPAAAVGGIGALVLYAVGVL